MNSKSITTLSIIVAIATSAIIVDKMLANFFSVYLLFLLITCQIITVVKFGLKLSLIYSFVLFICMFMFGSIDTYIYFPSSVVIGIVYGYMINKDKGTIEIFSITSVLFIIMEIISTFIVLPIFGFKVESTIEESIKLAQTMTNNMISYESVSFTLMIFVMVLVCVMFGLIQTFCVQIIVKILFNRLKLKLPKQQTLILFKPNVVLSYISFIVVSIWLLNLSYNFLPSNISYLVYSLLVISLCVLLFYGIVFFRTYTFIKGINFKLYLIISIFIFPYVSIIALLILGFLYGTGPLYNKLQGLYTR